MNDVKRYRSSWRHTAITLAVTATTVMLSHAAYSTTSDDGSRHAKWHHLYERRRADSAGQMRGLSSAWRNGADVSRDLRGRSTLGALDPHARRRTRDATLASRSNCWHSEVPKRSVSL